MIRRRMVLAFLGPALLLYLALLIVPALQAFYMSLFQASGFADTPVWVGLANYTRLWEDPVFWSSMRNMFLILLLGGVLVFGLAFVFTMLLTSGLWGKKLFRALIFMPTVIAITAITSFWSFIFMPRYGLLTNVLRQLGFENLAGVAWTAPAHVFWPVLAGVVWVSAGFFTILVLAGADKVPTDMYESARLEGASRLQIFRLITLPMIWDVVAIAMVLWVIKAINLVEFPYAFGGTPTPVEVYTPGIYLYIMGFGQRVPIYALGYATAIGVAMFVAVVVAVLALRRGLRREVLEF